MGVGEVTAMDKEKLRERLLGIFVSEVEGHVTALREGLAALETGAAIPGGEDPVVALRRAAHTVKGAARSAGVPVLQNAGWAMERIFRAAEEGRCRLDGDLVHLLLQATDAIDEARQRLCEKRDLTGAPLESLLGTLEEAAARCTSG
jgi:two-component system chemotaxis sensor kinase CheA